MCDISGNLVFYPKRGCDQVNETVEHVIALSCALKKKWDETSGQDRVRAASKFATEWYLPTKCLKIVLPICSRGVTQAKNLAKRAPELARNVFTKQPLASVAGTDAHICNEAIQNLIKKMEKMGQKTSNVAKGTQKHGNLANLKGQDFEDFLKQKLGGKGSFEINAKNTSREFDGAIGNIWYEAKAGKFWDLLLTSEKKLAKFKDDMGRGLSVAKECGALYELHSNTPIPPIIKEWLTKKGINFTEWL